ncbi:TPA: hypothetical protein QEF96_000383 [Stenotrophomonas maltophilia]|nr:hypothetical protein [Stenotrophomonas sp.]HDS1221720.1 hypothetical protein [Stenotrophomonas maltophilia]
MSRVDVLAVIDDHIGHYATVQKWARDEGNHHYADELDEHSGTLTQLRLTRTAITELQAAARAYLAARDLADQVTADDRLRAALAACEPTDPHNEREAVDGLCVEENDDEQ